MQGDDDMARVRVMARTTHFWSCTQQGWLFEEGATVDCRSDWDAGRVACEATRQLERGTFGKRKSERWGVTVGRGRREVGCSFAKKGGAFGSPTRFVSTSDKKAVKTNPLSAGEKN